MLKPEVESENATSSHKYRKKKMVLFNCLISTNLLQCRANKTKIN